MRQVLYNVIWYYPWEWDPYSWDTVLMLKGVKRLQPKSPDPTIMSAICAW